MSKLLNNLAFIAAALALTPLIFGACKDSIPSSKLAEVDGQIVSSADIDKSAGKELFNQRETLYKLEQKKVSEYIGALLLTKEAKRRGISLATLLDQEINSKIAAVTDSDIIAFYERNKERLRVDLETIGEQIRDYLRDQRVEAQKTALYRFPPQEFQDRHLSKATAGCFARKYLLAGAPYQRFGKQPTSQSSSSRIFNVPTAKPCNRRLRTC